MLPKFRVKFERRADGIGNGLAGGIVYGWAEAASGDDDIGAFQGMADGFGNASGVVTDGLCPEQVYAQAAQCPRDEAGIGVSGLAKQEFGTNGDNLCGRHRWIIKLLGGFFTNPR